MSPVTNLPDQRTAQAFAQQALWLMRQPQILDDSDEEGTALFPDPYVEEPEGNRFRSRREFLTRTKS
jgi:hypothetical protein